jgi:energy-coupling factor transport system ATP-binding protein
VPITLEHVSFRYDVPGQESALNGVSLSVPRGTCLGVLGANGSGKTTLVRHMNGLLRPAAGKVGIGGYVLGPGSRRPPELSREVGLVFQFPERQLFADTVFDDVAAGPRFAGMAEGEVRGRVHDALAAVGLDGGEYGDLSPFTLTWGEKRKVAIAGTLVMDPPRIIFDEPGAGLDPLERDMLLELVFRLVREEGRTVVMVSHHLDDIFRVADTVAVLEGGRVAFTGSVAEFCRDAEPERWGLRWPPLAAVMRECAVRGVSVRTDVRTPEEAAAELRGPLGRRRDSRRDADELQ